MKGNSHKKWMNNERVLMFSMIISIVSALLIVALGTIFLRMKVESLALEDHVAAKPYDYHYVLIVDDIEDPFWESVYKAAKEEGKKNNIYVELLGDNLSEGYTVNQRLRMAIESEVDGILVMPINEETTKLLDEAVDRGINVVTLLNDSVKGKRNSFIGINSSKLGKLYAEQVSKIEKPVGRVLVLVDTEKETEISNQMMVYLSIKEALEKDNILVETKSINKRNAFSAEETIRSIILSHKAIPDVMICLSVVDTLCAYQSLVDYNKVGEISMIGYYESETILEAVSKNIMTSTIFVDTQQMGIKAIEALYEYQTNGRVNAYFSVDAKVIDKDNVDKYIANP